MYKMRKFSVTISANLKNNEWMQSIWIYEDDLETYHCYVKNENGNVVTSKLIDEFQFVYPKLSFLKQEIITALENGRQHFLVENREIYKAIEQRYLSTDLLRKHISCWTAIDESGVVTRQDSKTNGIPDCDMKYHFKRLNENNPVMNIFNKNECPVCFDSYKKILEEHRHIVIPPCGHPICCNCCDETLRRKPECPCCRADVDVDELHVMKFNINLQPLPQERSIYY